MTAQSVSVAGSHKIHIADDETVLTSYSPKLSVAGYWVFSRFGRLSILLLFFIVAMIFQPGSMHMKMQVIDVMFAKVGGVPGLGMIILLLFALGYVFLLNAAKSYKYIITNQRVILTYGFLSINSRSIPIDKIADINVRASFFERLFGLASLQIDCIGTVFCGNRGGASNNTTAMEGLTMPICNEAMALLSQQMRAHKEAH